MEMIFQRLKDWGCDIEGALERFLDDKELYVTCLQTVIEDGNFKKLGDALAEGRISDAFDYAHTLKGVFSNLGLTPMYIIVESIVEPLRSGTSSDLKQPYEELLASNEHLKKIIGM